MTTRLISSLVALLVFLAVPTLRSQERSDFQTVKAFESQIKALSASIDEVQTVQECADVSLEIDRIEREFAPSKELLDKALYGDKFDERIKRLRFELSLAQEKLGVIEAQVTRIAELEEQVRVLSGEVERLSGENLKLLSDVERLSGNIKTLGESSAATGALVDSLRKVIGQLQKGIKERDQMIFALVDSLFQQYAKPVEQMADTEKRGLALRMDRNNIVTGVKSSIENNLKFLERAELKGSDLAAILQEHQRFSSQWKGLGPKLASIYLTSKQKAKELATVDTMLAAWSAKANDAYWRGVSDAIAKGTGLDVVPYRSGNEFVTGVTGYINARMAADAPSEEKAKDFARFDEMWNGEMVEGWLPLMESRGDLSADQRKLVEAKVQEWRESFEATSPFTYALLFVVIVAILTGLYVKMRKK
jgi:predicted  nucleic acid-binding Zn-ribbon protein